MTWKLKEAERYWCKLDSGGLSYDAGEDVAALTGEVLLVPKKDFMNMVRALQALASLCRIHGQGLPNSIAYRLAVRVLDGEPTPPEGGGS